MATITGPNQPDTIDLMSVSPGVMGGLATTGDDLVFAGNGNDVIFTGAGNDTIFGGNGDEFINACAGDDYIDGGRGDDSIILGSGVDTVVLTKDGGTDTITDFNATPEFRVVERTITFDDLPPAFFGLPIPNGYAGLNWSGVWEVSADNNGFNPSGFQNVSVVPGGNVAFDLFGDGGTISSPTGTFALKSVYMAAAWEESASRNKWLQPQHSGRHPDGHLECRSNAGDL